MFDSPHRAAGLLIALAAVALAGCSSGADAFPAACGEPASSFERALTAAPHAVRIEGTAISSCFARRDQQANIETLGGSLTTTADDLAAGVRTDPRSAAATQLGYLIAASERGAARTDGIHSELLRRLQMELDGLDTHTQQYASGYAAGRRFG